MEGKEGWMRAEEAGGMVNRSLWALQFMSCCLCLTPNPASKTAWTGVWHTELEVYSVFHNQLHRENLFFSLLLFSFLQPLPPAQPGTTLWSTSFHSLLERQLPALLWLDEEITKSCNSASSGNYSIQFVSEDSISVILYMMWKSYDQSIFYFFLCYSFIVLCNFFFCWGGGEGGHQKYSLIINIRKLVYHTACPYLCIILYDCSVLHDKWLICITLTLCISSTTYHAA